MKEQQDVIIELAEEKILREMRQAKEKKQEERRKKIDEERKINTGET